jgi:quinoprotein glucose dehydrogenase
MKRAIASVCGMLASVAAFGAEPITPANVSGLEVIWTYDTGDPTEPLAPGGKAPAFEATPVVKDGVLYLSTPMGTVAALDADSGKELWRVDLKIRRNTDYSDFANRGPAVHGEHIYVGTNDGRLACLVRKTGKFCPQFGEGGQIDLIRGLRHTPQWFGEYGVTSPPAVYRDVVIVGSSVADNSRAQMSSGEVRAFDARTGALRWRFHPLPENSPAGGANAWSLIVVDQENGLVFIPTGSPSPDYFGGTRPGANADANSMVVLKAATGERVWAFQTIHHDLWDYDVASAAVLYPGAKGPAVAVGNKSGHVFLLDRFSGKPLFPVVEKPVPASDVPDETAFPTQPFPTKPQSLVPQQVTEADLWGATSEELESCRATFRSLRNEGVFTPPSLQGTLNVPGNIGGIHWGGLTWDPTHRLLIAPVNRFPAIIRLIPQAQFDAAKKEFPQRETTEQHGTPYGMSREFFVSPQGNPCIAPPWGELVAVQVDTGDIAWRVTLGDLSNATDAAHATGSPNLGGVATTGTGLAFVGATLDASFRAFDTASGKEVWKAKLPTGARATPLIFKTGKREMVAIAAGGHSHKLSPVGTKLIVFGLR